MGRLRLVGGKDFPTNNQTPKGLNQPSYPPSGRQCVRLQLNLLDLIERVVAAIVKLGRAGAFMCRHLL
jgi:hypothetical protein